MEWARSHARSALRSPRQLPCAGREHRDILFPRKSSKPQVEAGFESWNDLLEPISTQGPMPWESESASLDLSGSLLDDDSLLLSSTLNETKASQGKAETETADALASIRSLSDRIPSYVSSPPKTSTQPPSDLELNPMYHQVWLASRASQISQTYSSLRSTPVQSPRRLSDTAWMSLNQQSSHWASSQRSLSPFSIDQQMITRSNCHLTSAYLLQIYHDVLEYNLSCWLSKITCPYQASSRITPQIVPERSSSRSNMMYQRTIRLDRVAQSCNLLQLTQAEDQAASKALHLAIMAFAVQWAQSSRRPREKYPARPLDNCEDDLADWITDEFDLILQHQFWDQAQRALQQVADLESYRVACAEFIFGLTQRPWKPNDRSPRERMQKPGRKFATKFVFSTLQDIMNKEGPPIYMERAARKMHALKYCSDAREKGISKQCCSREKGAHGIMAMGAEDRETIGLLYWMVIMCDTISSSINERPVVVLDQDCQHEGQKEIQQTEHSDESVGGSQWNIDIFLKGNFKQTHRTHWPCSYEAAAEDIIKSAPVKVLLFRHLSYLQNAVRKSAPEEQIEEVIRTAMLLYEHWNQTHGAFFSELVQNYHAVSQRIQGWFLCISAHWYLAAMMLADLLELIDGNSLGAESATHIRITSQVARTIRMHSARELSDLARVGTPSARNSDHQGVPQMSDFYHAVSKGTLLTEPWTMILIRAFTKACMVFLSDADESLRYSGPTLGHNSPDFERNLEQAQDCMKGLWLLGKKSDMAREITETLSLTLEELRNHM
ncbi:Fungal transcriptional regulatory protein, N-terminal [Penicillium digitatum]|nr:Fungal transcriptional regulatory protein, N-terminal [Penicillium digitatum]